MTLNLEPRNVFKYFEEISSIPRGSGNMKGIADYCMNFAEKHSLKVVRDAADNIIIYKDATAGYENSPSVILQGHLDMVCQKENGCELDFEKDGIDIFVKDGFVTANGTTLGGDNGIADAMMLAILESDDLKHPSIEAVFTTDEEIGMLGAAALDMSLLKSKLMINIDSEEQDVLTVSCAGGAGFGAVLPLERENRSGKQIKIKLDGLLGGHSGVEIDKGRVNADILAGRILNYLNKNLCDSFSIISVNGGDKDNAITRSAEILLCTEDAENLIDVANRYLDTVKNEISAREPAFYYDVTKGADGEFSVITPRLKDKIIYLLVCTPNGITEMSAEIDGLVETSLNLGILKTTDSELQLQYALRSNKKTCLEFLIDKMETFFGGNSLSTEVSGVYPPWEFNANSKLQQVYKREFENKFGYPPRVEAIHAGLECGIFADKIEGMDCISIGPNMYDIHTTEERLSITSVGSIYEVVLKVLEDLK